MLEEGARISQNVCGIAEFAAATIAQCMLVQVGAEVTVIPRMARWILPADTG